jgi:hypothetical protein
MEQGGEEREKADQIPKNSDIYVIISIYVKLRSALKTTEPEILHVFGEAMKQPCTLS